jgi:hypothetical protein
MWLLLLLAAASCALSTGLDMYAMVKEVFDV